MQSLYSRLVTKNLLEDLEARGLIHDTTDRGFLNEALTSGMVTFYHGIDPTADSLHIGSLVGVLAMRRFQDFGHKPIALVGGSTGMVGDPGGRSEERNLLDAQALADNIAGIQGQISTLMDFGSDAPNAAVLVNNFDWTGSVGVLDFLRDVGKHITVNQMMAKDSVKSRLDSEHGISFTEFSYMLLQAFDFWWLHENMAATLQIGGSDQWGNITAGTELIRKRSGASAHALTWPLLVRSDGAKFGKSQAGNVWLSPDRTLPYEFHQYFLRVPDADVERMLLQLTLLPVDEISAIAATHEEEPEKRSGQQRLADEVTALVHGPEAVRQAILAASAMFGSEDLNEEMAEALRGIIPETTVTSADFAAEQNLVVILVASELCTSKSDARRKLGENQISVNGVKTQNEAVPSETLVGGRYLLVQRGKKERHLIIVEG